MIYLIRHGQTAMNIARRLQGRRDEPLNDTGREQARAAAAHLRAQGVVFDRVISSPLCRAYETAQLLSFGSVPIETDERLMELDCGPYEGMDLRAPSREVGEFFKDFTHAPTPAGMEPLDHVVERAGAFLRDLKGLVSPEETVLITTHAIALKGLLQNLDPRPDGAWWNYPVHNCGGYVFALQDRAYTRPEELDYTREAET